MAASTRPLTLGEILDRTVQLYRRNFLLFTGISFLPSALYVLVAGGAGVYLSSQLPGFAQTTTPGTPNVQALLAMGLFALLFFLVGLPLLLGILSMAFSALNYAAFHTNREDAVTVRAAYAYSFRLFWRHVGILFLQFLFAWIIPVVIFSIVFFIVAMLAALLATTASSRPLAAILSGLLIFVSIIAMLVVCIWIWLRFCLAYPAAVTEGKEVWPSMQRSAQLSKGSRGRIFVMYLLVAILAIVSYYALTLPVDIVLKLTLYKSAGAVALLTRPPALLQVVNLFVNCLERTFVMPIYAIALLLFYNDQRTRKEGYDIELLMANAGWSNLPPQPPPIPPPHEAVPVSVTPIEAVPVEAVPVEITPLEAPPIEAAESLPPTQAHEGAIE